MHNNRATENNMIQFKKNSTAIWFRWHFFRRSIGNLNIRCDTKEHSTSVIMNIFQVLGQRFYINSLIHKHLSSLIPFRFQCEIIEIAQPSFYMWWKFEFFSRWSHVYAWWERLQNSWFSVLEHRFYVKLHDHLMP